MKINNHEKRFYYYQDLFRQGFIIIKFNNICHQKIKFLVWLKEKTKYVALLNMHLLNHVMSKYKLSTFNFCWRDKLSCAPCAEFFILGIVSSPFPGQTFRFRGASKYKSGNIWESCRNSGEPTPPTQFGTKTELAGPNLGGNFTFDPLCLHWQDQIRRVNLTFDLLIPIFWDPLSMRNSQIKFGKFRIQIHDTFPKLYCFCSLNTTRLVVFVTTKLLDQCFAVISIYSYKAACGLVC